MASRLRLDHYHEERDHHVLNEVKTPIQNYFEKVLYENLTF
jgi:hypothetical protein